MNIKIKDQEKNIKSSGSSLIVHMSLCSLSVRVYEHVLERIAAATYVALPSDFSQRSRFLSGNQKDCCRWE